jgi:hypothetical protein
MLVTFFRPSGWLISVSKVTNEGLGLDFDTPFIIRSRKLLKSMSSGEKMTKNIPWLLCEAMNVGAGAQSLSGPNVVEATT